jgi:hypothetical protein
MLPTIGPERPSAPKVWPSSRAEFGLERHHILPYSVLRDIWNSLLHSFTTTNFAEARVAVRQYLRLCNNQSPDIEDLLTRLRGRVLSVIECNVLAQSAVWAAWNIVEGPRNRSDDPHARELDRFTFGITREEFRRMSVIESLFHAMELFNAIGDPGANDLGTLTTAISLARSSLSFVRHPIPFRPEMWEQEPGGRWHKRRSGEQFLIVR